MADLQDSAAMASTLDALIEQYGSADALAAAAKGRAIRATQEYFGEHIQAVTLTVPDWKDLKLFLSQPNTRDYNVQAVYEQLLTAADDAIKAADAQALVQNLLLVFKAVRRV